MYDIMYHKISPFIASGGSSTVI